MGRGVRRGGGGYAPKVQKVELSDKHVKARLILALAFLVVAVASISYAVVLLTGVEKGWQVITATGDGSLYAEELVLNYDLGALDRSAKSESRSIKAIYSEACLKAGKALDDGQEATGNLYTLNASPNEEVKLDEALYEALELIEKYGDRTIYLGPAFRLYANIFSCTEDWQTLDFDPEENGMLRELFGRIAGYARDPASVAVELLGDGKAILRISDEYLSFLEEEELGGALSFGWMKNAFLVDYAADSLAQAGFRRGNLSSYDGYIRNLDEDSGISYSLNLFDRPADLAFQAARLDYHGPMSFVSYRNFPVVGMDERRFYITADGKRKTLYLSLENGLPRTAADSFTVYSDQMGCAELMLASALYYGKEEMVGADLEPLRECGIRAVLIKDHKLLATDPDVALEDVYMGYEVEALTDGL